MVNSRRQKTCSAMTASLREVKKIAQHLPSILPSTARLRSLISLRFLSPRSANEPSFSAVSLLPSPNAALATSSLLRRLSTSVSRRRCLRSPVLFSQIYTGAAFSVALRRFLLRHRARFLSLSLSL